MEGGREGERERRVREGGEGWTDGGKGGRGQVSASPV